MSYLNSLRLHFAGKFQAAPSTVNNDPLHFNNATFQRSYQQRQLPKGPPDGWWNPQGDATWRLIDCAVTSAWTGNAPAAQPDAIYSCLVADSDRTVAAKLVDLDPEQQLVSEVWGLHVRICTSDGANLMRAHYRTAAFADIWDRATGAGGGGDIGAGAMYQSELYDIEWGNLDGSAFLRSLRDKSSARLSIKFNVDGYNMSFGSPEFTKGRIVGTIGPATAAEPAHLVNGRHFMAQRGPGGNFFSPLGGINFCVATLDESDGRVYVDLGNGLPTTQPGSPPANLGALSLACLAPPPGGGNPAIQTIGPIPYLDSDWYPKTAGIAVLPADRALTAAEIATIKANPLALVLTDSSGKATPAIAEPPDGLYVRADRFVYRLDPGDSADVHIYATQFGLPYADARVISVFDPSQLQAQEFSLIGTPPDVAVPQGAVDFPARVVTDSHGLATLTIRAGNPADPRQYIDGQVYGVRPILEDMLAYGTDYPFNQWEFVSLLLFDSFQPAEPLTWFGSMQPIFRQYANLYPVMLHFLDLGDYDSVSANVRLLRLAFGLPREDPNAMPVTRDLSTAKKKAILRWLSEPGPDGKPRKGTQPPAAPAPPAAPPLAIAEAKPAPELERGGKAAAAARRLVMRPKPR